MLAEWAAAAQAAAAEHEAQLRGARQESHEAEEGAARRHAAAAQSAQQAHKLEQVPANASARDILSIRAR